MKKFKVVLGKTHHTIPVFLTIRFQYNERLKRHVESHKGVTWNSKYQYFQLPFSNMAASQLITYLQAFECYVDYRQLKNSKKNTTVNHAGEKANGSDSNIVLEGLNAQRFNGYLNYLRGMRLSQRTQLVYGSFVKQFLHYHKKRTLKSLEKEDFRFFVESIIKERQYSISSHRQLVSALKHFSTLFMTMPYEGELLERPKRSQTLPTVLSLEEVIWLIRVTRNLKHRAILALLYSAGLRIGECLNLKISDIDINRQQIRIENSKGRKDRYTVLAESFIPLLKNYLNTYAPTHYFIEGQNGGRYSASSIRKFLGRSCRRAGIQKKVTPHTLRHSYATHLIENGVGLRHVQELLGHSKPETTMIYTHVAQKDLLSIRSPLDIAVDRFRVSGKKPSNVSLSGRMNK